MCQSLKLPRVFGDAHAPLTSSLRGGSWNCQLTVRGSSFQQTFSPSLKSQARGLFYRRVTSTNWQARRICTPTSGRSPNLYPSPPDLNRKKHQPFAIMADKTDLPRALSSQDLLMRSASDQGGKHKESRGSGKLDEKKLGNVFIGSIDAGTTSSRFIIFDGMGNPVAQHQIEFTQKYPHSGYVTLSKSS